MTLRFDDVLKILEESLDIDLHIDEHRACNLLINDKISIQMELDKTEHYLVIGSSIMELPPGKFRENVLKAALKSNYGKEKGIGTLSYIPKRATLFLFEMIPLNFMTEDKVFEFFAQFLTKATIWKDNLESGRIPHTTSQGSNFSPLNPFGIR